MILNSKSLANAGANALISYKTVQYLTPPSPQSFTTALAAGACAAVATVALDTIGKYVTPRHQESWNEMIGRWALKVPAVQVEYDKQVQQEYTKFKDKAKEQWAKFGKPYVKLPERGLTLNTLRKLVHKYAKLTNDPLCKEQLSGTVYSPSLNKKTPTFRSRKEPKVKEGTLLDKAIARLKVVLPEAQSYSSLWNPLHKDDFPIGNFIEYQVVQMIGNMFGSERGGVNGFVTSGGTESLMQSVYGYRQWGREKLGHSPTESVIIAPDTIHASLDKAERKFDVKVVKLPTDKHGNVSIDDVKSAMETYGKRVVALYGSAPNYPTGQEDPIEAMAKMAQDAGIGMHVDCCLGAFVINNVKQRDYLKMPGVTSLSADTHKFGYTPKGSSVLLGVEGAQQDIIYHSAFSVPNWKGGVYGTPRDPGSQSSVPAFQTLLTLLAVGKKGYQESAKSIQRTTHSMKEMIETDFKEELQVLGNSDINVLAFKIHENLGYETGATYALVDLLKKEGFILNAIKGDATHFAVTARAAQDATLIERLKTALKKTLAEVKDLNEKVKKKEAAFSGDAPLYCTVAEIAKPLIQEQTFGKYFENKFLGPLALKETVFKYFKALQDPYA